MRKVRGKISILRVFIALTIVLEGVFLFFLINPLPLEIFSNSLRVLGGLYFGKYLIALGLLGLLLSLKENQLLIIAINLLLTPCVLIIHLSSGEKVIGLVPPILSGAVIFALCVFVLNRFSSKYA